MSREPEAVVQRRRALGRQLATFRRAAELTQAQLARRTYCDRTRVAHLESGSGRADQRFWIAADEAVRANGALVTAYTDLEVAKQELAAQERARELAAVRAQADQFRAAHNANPSLTGLPHSSLILPLASAPSLVTESTAGDTEPVDDAYIASLRRRMQDLLAIDAQFGGNEASAQALRLFRSVHRQIGVRLCPRQLQRDLYATTGELAEIAGWLLYDADEQDAMRRINQEALYYLRWAGDRSVELLTLQNIAMQAEYLRRPAEALHIADSVLGNDRLSPRLKSLFLARRSHAFAQQQQGQAARRAFDKAHALYLDGTRDDDPPWANWVDDRQFAWFEAVLWAELGQPNKTVDIFAEALATSPRHRVRGMYSRTGYLFDSLVNVSAWHDAERLVSELAHYITEVGSGRTAAILRETLRKIRASSTPNLQDGAAYLRGLLDGRG